ncbi:MAG: HlyD family efflux transporter periplasmic adaptor subunit [Coleofasciculaceae cyanobacterium]
MNQQNGSNSNRQNGLGSSVLPNAQNGSAGNSRLPKAVTTTANKTNDKSGFDQSVILRQSANWSHAILWTIVAVTTGGLIWASLAEIEQAVPAQGKLEPKGAVNEVKAPRGGVVTEINIKDGQEVKQGDLLLTFEPKATQAQLSSLSKIRATLVKENQFYRSQMRNGAVPVVANGGLSELEISREITSLAESRKVLLAENELYRAQLRGDSSGANFTPQQRERLQVASRELQSRIATNESEIRQLEKRLDQTKIQLANSRELLQVERGILDDLKPLYEEGGFSKIQYLRQDNEVKRQQAEADQLVDEELRLQFDIAQAKEQLKNTIALSEKELTDKMADNDKRVSEIDSELNKRIVENEKRIAEIDSQLSEANLTLSYQQLVAPVSGTVFDLKPSAPGFVANSAEPVLKIVPSDKLVARVYLTNKDIGFVDVEKKMDVDVRIDSFPFSEFGDIKGKLVSIGSDALPPDQQENRPFYSFPAEISLEQQSLMVNEQPIPLQSGMSVSVNIKTRKRSVLSIFTELFTDKTESLKTVR